MSMKRVIGILLVVIGIVALVWGGVFWTREKTVLDAGPVELSTKQREGVALPRVLGIVALIGGIALIAIPERRRT